jgi:SRSO17 transposase
MLFMCDSDINASITDFIRRMWANSDEYWYIGRFDLHIKRLKYIGLDKKYNINLDKIPYPTTEEEAASILNRIKKQIFEKEWDLLSQETKSMILQKYEKFKKFPELYDKMIMDHVLHVLNLDWIDLYTLS